MKKEVGILLLSSILSIVFALLIFRLLAPGLFGMPRDLEVVQLKRKLPPFYTGALNLQDGRSTEFLLHDPVTGVRARPLLPAMQGLGPHDLLGFRNEHVPRRADIIAIGDSQTYGNNALQHESWPAVLEQVSGLSVYSMATGSWSVLQYLEMARRALLFKPAVIIIALYTGNDAHESFRMAYENSYWKKFRGHQELSSKDLPREEEFASFTGNWDVKFSDGSQMQFTPARRLVSVKRENKAIQAGFEVIKQALQSVGRVCKSQNIRLLLTIVPTKELAYSRRLAQEKVALRADYQELVDSEYYWIQNVEDFLQAEQLEYVSVIEALQDELLRSNALYPSDQNGHPYAAGYAVIARQLADHLSSQISPLADGFYRVKISEAESWFYMLFNKRRYQFLSVAVVTQNGLRPEEAREVPIDRLEGFPIAELIRGPDIRFMRGE